MNIINKLLFCFSIALLLGSCTEQYDLNTANEWFNTNELKVIQMKNAILKHPNIKRIEPNMNLEFVRKFGEFNDSDHLFYNQISIQMKEMGIVRIVVSRRLNENKYGSLLSVSFHVYSVGLLGGRGKTISIDYIPDKEFLNLFKKQEHINIQPLKKDWYIVEST